ncbi:MAG: hypothetical protein DWQ01_22225 [Planctomycetota bacterium]|nr:MAG: hypothetical protein DWQ01_22225 [Planctomycetota bacterium]
MKTFIILVLALGGGWALPACGGQHEHASGTEEAQLCCGGACGTPEGYCCSTCCDDSLPKWDLEKNAPAEPAKETESGS